MTLDNIFHYDLFIFFNSSYGFENCPINSINNLTILSRIINFLNKDIFFEVTVEAL